MKNLSKYALIAAIILFVVALVSPLIYSISSYTYSWSHCENEEFVNITFFESKGSPIMSIIPFLIRNLLFFGLFIGMISKKEVRSIAIVGGAWVLIGFGWNVTQLLSSLKLVEVYNMYLDGTPVPYSMMNDIADNNMMLNIFSLIYRVFKLVVIIMFLIRFRQVKTHCILTSLVLAYQILSVIANYVLPKLLIESEAMTSLNWYWGAQTLIAGSMLAMLMLSLYVVFKKKASQELAYN